jgi:hypothetical protein
VVAEHVMIHGTPVRFLVSPNPLRDQGLATAGERDLDGRPFRVMRPEYLAALWLHTGGSEAKQSGKPTTKG